MGNARQIGRVGALAVALGLGFAVAATPAVGYAEPTDSVTCQSADSAEPDTTALILGGTTVPTPDDAYIDAVRNHFIAPTHPGQINYCAVTAPMEAWPVTGIGRLGWLATGPPSIWGPGGPAWPAEPWWKLSGLFDLTFDQSVRAGVADLEDAMAKHPNDHLVIYGYSQGAIIANLEKRKLAEQYPAGTTAPDIDFVLSGDMNLPNGGLTTRLRGSTFRSSTCLSTAPPRPTPSSIRSISTGSTTASPISRCIRSMSSPCSMRFWAPSTFTRTTSKSALLIRRHRRLLRVSTATPPTTSSRRRTYRCSVRCAHWGFPSR